MRKELASSILKIAIALLLIGAVVFVVVLQNRDSGKSGRIDIFKGEGENVRGIEGYSLGRTAPFEDKALLVTTNTLLLLDSRGRGETEEISLSDPEISVGGKYIMAYNNGGRLALMYKNGKKVYELRPDGNLIDADVNEQGYAAVACDGEGGETRITIYNDAGKAFYTWTLGSGQFINMDLSDDNTHLVISSLSDKADEMLGELSVIRLDSEEKKNSVTAEGEIYFDVRINRDYSITALGSSRLDTYNGDGSLRWSLPYNGGTLRCADIRDPDMMILCTTAADSGLTGNSTEVEVVSRLGEVISSTRFDGLCESLSVNGGLFAASAGKKIFVFDKNCTLKRELSSTSAIESMSLFKNGKSVFVLSGSGGSIIT